MRRISVNAILIQSWWAIFAVLGLAYAFIGAFQGDDHHIIMGIVMFFGCMNMAALSHITGRLER